MGLIPTATFFTICSVLLFCCYKLIIVEHVVNIFFLFILQVNTGLSSYVCSCFEGMLSLKLNEIVFLLSLCHFQVIQDNPPSPNSCHNKSVEFQASS